MTYYKRNLIVLSITIGLTSLSWTQVIPFLPKFLTQLGVQNNLTAWSAFVLGLQSVAGIVFMPFWGKLGDKYGRKPMVVRAGFCLSMIYVGMFFCTQPWHLALLRFLNGMLTGFIPGSFALIATNTPDKKAGRYVAIAQSASAIGGIAGPVIGGVLADSLGIRGTMVISGAVVLANTLAVGWLICEPNKVKIDTPTTLVHDFIYCGKDPVLRYVMINNWTNAIIASSVTSTLVIYLMQIAPGIPGWVQGSIYAIPGVLIGILSLRWVKLGEQTSFQSVISAGLIGAGAFYVLMGLSANIWIFTSAFILCRIFATALNPVLSAVISRDVPSDFRGRAFGINTSVSTMGELSAQALVASFGQLFGINVLYILIGLAVFVMGIKQYVVLIRAKPIETVSERI